MNFTIPAADLRRMVDRLKPCRGVGPWVGRVDVGPTYLTATSAGESVSADALGVLLPGQEPCRPVTIPLRSLDAWLQGVDGTVTATQEGGVVVFTTDDATLPVALANAEHDPQLPALPDTDLSLPPEVWAALGRVSWAAEKVEPTPTFKSMLHVAKGRVWASDTYRLGTVEIPGLDADVSFWPDLAGVLREIDLGSAEMKLDRENRLHVIDDDGRYVLPTFIGEKPAVGIIEDMATRWAAQATQVTVTRKELTDALARLKPLVAADSGKVWLSAEDGTLHLHVVTIDDQPATRDIPCTGEAPTVAFLMPVLASVLASLDGDDVTLNIVDSKCGVTLKEGDYTALLMPIREGAPARTPKKPIKPRF